MTADDEFVARMKRKDELAEKMARAMCSYDGMSPTMPVVVDKIPELTANGHVVARETRIAPAWTTYRGGRLYAALDAIWNELKDTSPNGS